MEDLELSRSFIDSSGGSGAGGIISFSRPGDGEKVGSKLDGVGPVDNRPFTDKPNHFVQNNEQKKHDM